MERPAEHRICLSMGIAGCAGDRNCPPARTGPGLPFFGCRGTVDSDLSRLASVENRTGKIWIGYGKHVGFGLVGWSWQRRG